MENIEVLENGVPLSFTFDEMLKYHGPGYPGGAAHAFKVMQRAFPLLDEGRRLERREISLITAFPGLGGRDAFELVTRCLTDDIWRIKRFRKGPMSWKVRTAGITSDSATGGKL